MLYQIGERVLLRPPCEISDWDTISSITQKKYLEVQDQEVTIKGYFGKFYEFEETDLIVTENVVAPVKQITIDKNDLLELM